MLHGVVTPSRLPWSSIHYAHWRRLTVIIRNSQKRRKVYSINVSTRFEFHSKYITFILSMFCASFKLSSSGPIITVMISQFFHIAYCHDDCDYQHVTIINFPHLLPIFALSQGFCALCRFSSSFTLFISPSFPTPFSPF